MAAAAADVGPAGHEQDVTDRDHHEGREQGPGEVQTGVPDALAGRGEAVDDAAAAAGGEGQGVGVGEWVSGVQVGVHGFSRSGFGREGPGAASC